mmetsp:Transcript_127289/g.271385  ORF Transcript_127289/g.271385 Transcript_127289/m.271385 type:complete len:246 (-) Transcript_127289:873-1610(-)
MVRVGFERLVRKLVALLEFSKLKREQAAIESWLEQVRPQAHRRVEVRLRLLHIALPQLQDAEVAVALRMIRINRDRDLEGLVSEAQVANADSDLPDIVPNIGHVVVIGEHERPFEAAQGKVVLSRVEAAETHVVPKLCIGDPVLQQAAVEPKCQLGLVSVKVVRGEASDCLRIHRVVLQHALVELHAPQQGVEHVVGPRQADKDVRVTHKLLPRTAVLIERGVGLVKAQVHLAQFQVGHDHFLVL